MSNPAADYPASLHSRIDTSGFDNIALGATAPVHTDVHGKLEEEVYALQAKAGIGSSLASAASTNSVLVKQAGGSTTWNILTSDQVTQGSTNLFSQWTTKTSTYTFLTPSSASQNFLIGNITAGLAPIVAVGQPKAIFADDSGTGTNFFVNHGAGTGFAFGGVFISARSRGTADVPTAVQAGDFVGGLASFAYDGSSYAAHGVSHLLPGIYSVVTGTPALAAVDRKIYLGSLSGSMISFDTFDNSIKLNESNLIATTTIGWDSGTALTVAGATGIVTLGVVGTVASSVTTIDGTQTLTNKRVTPRVTSIVSSATPTINTDSCDFVDITALAAAITSMTTNLSGTATNGQRLTIRFKDNATARGITWGASFEACGVALPSTTVISKRLTVGFIYDTTTSKWGCVASVQES